MPSPNFNSSEVDISIENQANKEMEAVQKSPETYVEIPQTKEALEKEIAPEKETITEEPEIKKEGFLDDTIENLKNTLKGTKTKPTQIPQVKDKITFQVEKIMEQGLEDAYKEMTPVQQQEFKIKGERTAIEIRAHLKTGKVKVKKIFKLILEWLKLLPGVNRFFLEQEAKIKSDKIISLKKFDDLK
jgi:N-acetyl-beta-hexosaminidase